jgi:hypothetical protein
VPPTKTVLLGPACGCGPAESTNGTAPPASTGVPAGGTCESTVPRRYAFDCARRARVSTRRPTLPSTDDAWLSPNPATFGTTTSAKGCDRGEVDAATSPEDPPDARMPKTTRQAARDAAVTATTTFPDPVSARSPTDELWARRPTPVGFPCAEPCCLSGDDATRSDARGSQDLSRCLADPKLFLHAFIERHEAGTYLHTFGPHELYQCPFEDNREIPMHEVAPHRAHA